MRVIHDPILGTERKKDIIPQLSADPSSPKSQETWVRRTFISAGAGAGEPYGLLLALTQPGADSTNTYQLSYRTKQGTTVRVALT